MSGSEGKDEKVTTTVDEKNLHEFIVFKNKKRFKVYTFEPLPSINSKALKRICGMDSHEEEKKSM